MLHMYVSSGTIGVSAHRTPSPIPFPSLTHYNLLVFPLSCGPPSTLWPDCKLAVIEGDNMNHSLRVTSTSRLYQSGPNEQPNDNMNHSLRVTSTSRLYQSGPNEQPNDMERPGHRSIKGIHRMSDKQKRAMSEILNRVRKTARVN